MEWLKSLYEFLGSEYPRASIVVAATIGAIVFGGGWWLIGKQYEKAKAAATTATTEATAIAATPPPMQTVLMPAQVHLLDVIAKHQREFAANKLVVGRRTGLLHFDGNNTRGAGVNLLRDVFGSEDAANGPRFEELMESMPSEYLRLFPEMRWDNPFVVTVTEGGIRYLQGRK